MCPTGKPTQGTQHREKKNPKKTLIVPEIGIEPIHPCGRQILSLLRLPIPPPGPESGVGSRESGVSSVELYLKPKT